MMEGRSSLSDHRPLFFESHTTIMITTTMPRQIRILKRARAGAPVIVPIKVVQLLSDQELRRDRESVVNDWIDERRQNERAENLYSQAAIFAWRKDPNESD